MLTHIHARNWRRLHHSYFKNLRSRYYANIRRNREFYINLCNYLTYNDVD